MELMPVISLAVLIVVLMFTQREFQELKQCLEYKDFVIAKLSSKLHENGYEIVLEDLDVYFYLREELAANEHPDNFFS